MKTVELIYDSDCPNVDKARAQIGQALKELALPLNWKEWDRGDTEAPPYVQNYASPTVLVGGRDVVGDEGIDGTAGCRVYVRPDGGFQGVPPLEAITAALGGKRHSRSMWRGSLASMPAIGAVLLPALGCPACWPAYAGFLGSLGVGFFNYTPYLLPLTLAFLIMALASFAYHAPKRRGYGPLALGVVASLLILLGKFASASNVTLFVGIAVLIGASVWNAWPRARRSVNKMSLILLLLIPVLGLSGCSGSPLESETSADPVGRNAPLNEEGDITLEIQKRLERITGQSN